MADQWKIASRELRTQEVRRGKKVKYQSECKVIAQHQNGKVERHVYHGRAMEDLGEAQSSAIKRSSLALEKANKTGTWPSR